MLYGAIAAMSLYEFVNAPVDFPTVDYVRAGLTSSVFFGFSVFTAISFWRGFNYSRCLLALSLTLLIIFVYPGLNTVWNYVLGWG